MSNPLTIFVVTSITNPDAAKVVIAELALGGHSVLGWTARADMLFRHRAEREPGLLSPEEQALFNGITAEVCMADFMVAIPPLDRDAVFLTAAAHISGVPVAVLLQEPWYGSIPLTLKGATNFWCQDVEALLKVIKEWPCLVEDQSPAWPSEIKP